MPPQDFESLAGTKAMKSWKKFLKHKGQPLLTYLTSGALKDCDEQGQTVLDDASTLSQTINSALKNLNLDSHLHFKRLLSHCLALSRPPLRQR